MLRKESLTGCGPFLAPVFPLQVTDAMSSSAGMPATEKRRLQTLSSLVALVPTSDGKSSCGGISSEILPSSLVDGWSSGMLGIGMSHLRVLNSGESINSAVVGASDDVVVIE